MTKLSQEQVGELAELRERGWSYARLAARYGVSSAAIHYRCLTAGALSPRSQGLRAGDDRKPLQGFGGLRHPFSPEEDARLLRLARQGEKMHRIAELMGRPRTSVRIRLLTIELKADLEPAS